MIETSNCRGELTDISAKKEALAGGAAIELRRRVGVCVSCVLGGLDPEEVFFDTELEHVA